MTQPNPPSTIPDLLSKHRQLTLACLSDFFNHYSQETKELPNSFQTLYSHITKNATTGGKFGRPTLARLAYNLSQSDLPDSVIKATSVIELFHRYILIHDDIIDGDQSRHGIDTLQFIYQKQFNKLNLEAKQAQSHGISMAIVGGDLMQHLAHLLLVQANLPNTTLNFYLKGLHQCYVDTVAGWTQETQLKQQSLDQVSQTDIKTAMNLVSAHYSVLWPLRLGQILAGSDYGQWHKALETYGHHIGLAFQLQDDVLGLIGDTKQTGKPVGNDIREAKKSLLVWHAYHNSSAADQNFLNSIMGQTPSKNQLDRLHSILKNTQTLKYATDQKQQAIDQALSALNSLPSTVNLEAKSHLTAMAHFLSHRNL